MNTGTILGSTLTCAQQSAGAYFQENTGKTWAKDNEKQKHPVRTYHVMILEKEKSYCRTENRIQEQLISRQRLYH